MNGRFRWGIRESIVISLCVVLTTAALWPCFSSSKRTVSPRQLTRQRLDVLGRACGAYRAVKGVYPPQKMWTRELIVTMMGEKELSELPDIRDILESFYDGWGRPMNYICPGILHPSGSDLYSCGPDGVDDGGRNDDLMY